METVKLLNRCREMFWQNTPTSKVREEWQALTEQDKADLIKYFNDAGLPTN